MPGMDIKIGENQFDSYLSLPESGRGPGLIIMASVYGVDDDARAMADSFATKGFPVSVPDLFWRGDKGGLTRSETDKARAKARGADRAVLIENGVGDLAEVMADLKARPECNGRIAVLGLCYGGPYAILGPARLGCDAGISFHGTQVQNYLDPVDKVTVPLSLHWGDKDHAAPPEALDRIRAAIAGMENAELIIYPGVEHGYSGPAAGDAYDVPATEASMARTLEILEGLRAEGETMAGAAQ